MKTITELLAIAEFLGDEMTNEQATKLMDEARHLSIADCERLLANCPGTRFYPECAKSPVVQGGDE